MLFIIPMFLMVTIFVVVNGPPVGEVCLNYEVMKFQPLTVTLRHLGSFAFRFILI